MEKKRRWLLASAVVALALLGVTLVAGSVRAGAFEEGAGVEPGVSHANWSSGWTTVPAGTCQAFNHGLGGDPLAYAVEMWFLDTDNDMGINRTDYGGLEVAGYWRGTYWQQFAADTIDVCRHANDMSAEQLLIRVWQPPKAPDYDSGWLNIAAGETLVVSHSLGISATELSVGLWFSSTARGIHHAGYGGLSNDVAEELHGAYWKDLTDNTVRVQRAQDDTLVEQVRVIVTHPEPPDYDSLVALGGWLDLPYLDPVTFTHNLNWPPYLQFVQAECKSAGFPGPGINQVYAGGNHDWFIGWQGAHVQNVERNSLRVERRVNDQVCPQARIRIWKRGYRVFLPIVRRSPAAK